MKGIQVYFFALLLSASSFSNQCSDLLQTIAFDVDNVAPRLKFAEWVSEMGFPQRAELIRLQIELGRHRRFSAEHLSASLKAERIISDHGIQWIPERFREIAQFSYVNGFVERLAIGASDFLVHGVELTQKFPIKAVTFTSISSRTLGKILKKGLLSKVRFLGLADGFLDVPILDRLKSEYLPELRALDVASNYLGDLGLERVMELSVLGNLEELDLSFNDIGDEGLEILCRSPRLKRLQRLNLSQNQITDDGLRVLARKCVLKNLRALDIGGNQITANGLIALVNSRNLSLRELSISGSRLTDFEIEAIARGAQLKNLESLNLSVNDITHKGLEEFLQQSIALKSLRILNLGSNPIGERGGQLFVDSQLISRLLSLDLSRTDLGDRGLMVLAGLSRKSSLTHLNLAFNEIGDKGIRALSRCSSFPQLLSLDLNHNDIGEADFMVLTSSAHFKKVISLRR